MLPSRTDEEMKRPSEAIHNLRQFNARNKYKMEKFRSEPNGTERKNFPKRNEETNALLSIQRHEHR